MSITSVDFALLIRDDFSGKIIDSADLQFHIDGRAVSPLRKDDGFFVFLGDRGELKELSVSSIKYETTKATIDPAQIPETEPILNLRMLRKHNVYFDDTGAVIKGNSSKLKGSQCELRCYAVDGPVLKLSNIENNEKSSIITVTGFTFQNLKGLKFSMGEGKAREIFVITSKTSHNTYELDRILSFPHKNGELMTRVYSGQSESDGSYSIFVDSGQEDKIKKIEYLREGKVKWASL